MEHYTFNINDSRRLQAMQREVEMLRKRSDTCVVATIIMGFVIAVLLVAVVLAEKL